MTQPLPGTHAAPYLGSPASTPLYGNLAQMAALQRRDNPEANRLVGQGVGLDGVTVPELAAFQLGGTVATRPGARREVFTRDARVLAFARHPSSAAVDSGQEPTLSAKVDQSWIHDPTSVTGMGLAM